MKLAPAKPETPARLAPGPSSAGHLQSHGCENRQGGLGGLSLGGVSIGGGFAGGHTFGGCE
jgi:hypothetical protein